VRAALGVDFQAVGVPPVTGEERQMKCPKCKDTRLIEKKVKGREIKVDMCPDCKGIWFDEDELGTLLRVPSEEIKIPPDAREQGAFCPRCRIPLRAFCYPHTMVVIDMCGKCEGIWLNDKELKEIQGVRKTLKKVESSGKKMVCLNCGCEQAASGECIKCGIVFSKYRNGADQDKDKPPEESEIEKSLHLPGIKGSLLQFIDNAIESLRP